MAHRMALLDPSIAWYTSYLCAASAKPARTSKSTASRSGGGWMCIYCNSRSRTAPGSVRCTISSFVGNASPPAKAPEVASSCRRRTLKSMLSHDLSVMSASATQTANRVQKFWSAQPFEGDLHRSETLLPISPGEEFDIAAIYADCTVIVRLSYP